MRCIVRLFIVSNPSSESASGSVLAISLFQPKNMERFLLASWIIASHLEKWSQLWFVHFTKSWTVIYYADWDNDLFLQTHIPKLTSAPFFSADQKKKTVIICSLCSCIYLIGLEFSFLHVTIPNNKCFFVVNCQYHSISNKAAFHESVDWVPFHITIS